MCRITVPIKKAARAFGGQAAKRNRLQNRIYQKIIPLSNKNFLGELLLFGDHQSREFWPAFEVLLRTAV